MRNVIKSACVYQIISKTTGSAYVGSTKQFNLRRSSHLTKLKRRIHGNKNLQLNVDQFGLGDLEFSVIEKVYDLRFLVEREQYYIDTLKPDFNINLIAGKIGPRNSIESIEIIAGKLRGRTMSDEVKQKISTSNTGKRRIKGDRVYLMTERRRKVKCIETDIVYDHAGIVANVYGCTPAAIYLALNGQSKTAKGFHFSYA